MIRKIKIRKMGEAMSHPLYLAFSFKCSNDN